MAKIPKKLVMKFKTKLPRMKTPKPGFRHDDAKKKASKNACRGKVKEDE